MGLPSKIRILMGECCCSLVSCCLYVYVSIFPSSKESKQLSHPWRSLGVSHHASYFRLGLMEHFSSLLRDDPAELPAWCFKACLYCFRVMSPLLFNTISNYECCKPGGSSWIKEFTFLAEQISRAMAATDLAAENSPLP